MIRDDRVKIFRDVCHSYPYYQAEIKRIDDRLTILQNKMEGVYSPVTDRIGSTPTPHEQDYITIIQQKEQLENLKQHYLDLIQWMMDVIDAIPSPAYRALVWSTYVQRRSLQSVSDQYLVRKDSMYKIRKKHLDYVLNDERMEKYDEIMSRKPAGPETVQ